MLTQSRLKEMFVYYPNAGIFVSRKKSANGKIKKWQAVLCDHPAGYKTVWVDGKRYLAHRLAWLYVYGYSPEGGIDHINRDPSDNRIVNLREASQQCNQRNVGIQKNNTSGVKGVSRYKNKLWSAQITVNREKYVLGRTDCKLEAACLRYAAEQCLNWNDCDTGSTAGAYIRRATGSMGASP